MRRAGDDSQAGLIPPEIDADGNAVNPHIPRFMAAAPWYLNQDGPGLKHQKAPEKEQESTNWYKRGVSSNRATTFRRGACENCGAMTHKKKDCMERPRAKGASKTQKDIAPDEYVQPELKLGFESKRDRYNGFDVNDYAKVVERYEAMEAIKQKLAKEKELEKAFRKANKKEGDASDSDEMSSDDDSDDDDDAKVGDASVTGFDNIKRAVRAPGGGASGTVRNLRLREDTAKYLRNLDVDSAYYDPKTRSMRENPTPNADPKDNFYRGDNAALNSGALVEFERMTRHAWEQAETGGSSTIHMQAAPSQAEALYKQFKEKKEKLAVQSKQSIMDKYGDASSGKAPEGLALGQTEQYVEYDRAGRLIKGTEKAPVRSRYEEDVYLQNHTSVWGSFWNAGKWGYACCKSTLKNSYCTGERGAAAALATEEIMASNVENKRAIDQANDARAKSQLNATAKPDSLWGGDVADDVQIDPKKLVDALKKHDEREEESKKGKNKRGYNVTHDSTVTAEDMEAYRMKKRSTEDPMNRAAGTDGYDLV